MYKLYFKQAWLMLKQNKFISTIAIMGTALAIMMIMSIIVADEIKSISVSPETNRDRSLYLYFQSKRDTAKGSWHGGNISYDILKDYLYPLKSPQYVSGVSNLNFDTPATAISKEGSNEITNMHLRMTDHAYWKIFTFPFTQGRAFSQEEFESGVPVTVITETVARKMFRGEEALGQTILIDFAPYRIIGITKDISPVFKQAYGELWIPYTALKRNHLYFDVVMLAENKKDQAAIIEEVRNMEKKFSTENVPWILHLRGPLTSKTNMREIYGDTVKEIAQSISVQKRKTIFILLILLLIPAINLSGLSHSRIKKRTEEIGIRKAFGAKKYTILIQVLFENLITSLLGGVIGLILSYVVIFQMRDWLLDVPSGSSIPVSTLISIPVLLAVFVVCLIINLLSAGIPAYRASRMKIINSLNQNDK